MPGTIVASGDLQVENGPLLPPVTPIQVKPVTHQQVPLWHWHPNTRTCFPGLRHTWPEEGELQEKLWGSTAALKKTADRTDDSSMA